MMRRILLSGAGMTTLVALVVGFGVGFAASVEVQVAILIGLVSALIGLAITAVFAFEERLNQIDDARVGALPLQRLLAMPELEGPIVRLIDAGAHTTAAHGPFMQSLVHETVVRASERVSGIADGIVRCEADDELRLVRRALENTQRSVRAVAARGVEWWIGPDADVYWNVYGHAALRIDITRIFVIRSKDAQEMEHVLHRHHRLGMKTFTVRADQVPPARISALVIFDDSLLHRHAPRQEAEAGYRIEFSDRGDDIIRAQETYHVLLELADEWSPDPSQEAEQSTVPQPAKQEGTAQPGA